MTTLLRYPLLLVATTIFTIPARAQKPADTEVWTPVPRVITPGVTDRDPPSDAIRLFDGRNLDEWVKVSDKSAARWKVADGVITVDKSAGNIETKRKFTNYQLHIEWRIPATITG
jgi:hypothetical protein